MSNSAIIHPASPKLSLFMFMFLMTVHINFHSFLGNLCRAYCFFAQNCDLTKSFTCCPGITSL